MTTIKKIVAEKHRELQRQQYTGRRWRCCKCDKTFRCRPEQVESLIDGTMEQAPTHCGIPMILSLSAVGLS